jgi:hypothetical protein
MGASLRTNTPHPPTAVCQLYHCWAHHVDEPLPTDGYHRACPRCRHVYLTVGELRRAYRRRKQIILRKLVTHLFRRVPTCRIHLTRTLLTVVTLLYHSARAPRRVRRCPACNQGF